MPKKDQDIADQIWTTLQEKLKEADLTGVCEFLLDEAIYIGLIVNLIAVSGKVRIFNDDGQTRTILGAQRLVIDNFLIFLRDATQFQVPLTSFKPLEWAYPWVNAWEIAVSTSEEIDGVAYYSPIDPLTRTSIILMLPGMLRIGISLFRDVVDLAR